MDIRKTGFDHRLSGDKQEIVTWLDTDKLVLDCCPHEAFCPVALHCIAQATPCGDTHTQALFLIFTDDQHNKRVGKRLSRTPHPLEIGCFFQSKPAFHLIDGARSCWVIIRSQGISLSSWPFLHGYSWLHSGGSGLSGGGS